MTINTNAIISVSEANQNFSRATRIAEKNGQVVIFKNNKPKYILLDIESNPIIEMTDDEKIDFVAARILKLSKSSQNKLHQLISEVLICEHRMVFTIMASIKYV